MKKILVSVFCLFALSNLFAQDNHPTGAELSIGLDAGLPTGDFNQGWKMGIGGTAKFAYNFTPAVAATFTTGYMSFSGKTFDGDKLPAVNFVPFKAGFRYTLDQGIYFEPQLGFTSASSKGGSSVTGFTYAINAGYRMTPGIDVGARYEVFSKDGNLTFIGLRVAYSFSLGGGN